MRYRSTFITAALCAALLLASNVSLAQIRISVNIAPPPLPVYTQPPLPDPGYLWVPGYWAWADGGYYWVPGTWVEPPQPGLLWTPGYWGWTDGAYIWHDGYWGPQVGFYGGVDYGFGYDGVGFVGGYWSRGAFFYNRAVNRIPAGAHIPHVYSRPVPQHARIRTSFNGGRGGIQARASAAQLAAGRGHHVEPIAAQRQQEQAAAHDPQFRAATNHGRPAIGATARPGQFTSHGGPPARSNGNVGNGNVHIPERAPARPAAGSHPGPAPRATPRATPHAIPHANVPARPNVAPRPTSPEHSEAHPGGARPAVRAPAHAAPRPAAHAGQGAPAEHREPQAREPERQPQ